MKSPQAIKTVAIVGNGRMGTGISQVFASRGMDVRLIGRSEESLARAKDTIESNLAEFVDRQVMTESDAATALARVSTGTDFGAAEDVDHVIEAVPADRALQIDVFGRLDEVCSPDVVLGSTSGQPISLMVERMKHPERAVAMHFVFPAQLITLVEVCGGKKTAPDVVTWACDMLKSIGYTPAVMNKEVDGFIINRLQFAILREAWSMWANGIASAQAIDDSFKLTLGRRYSVTGPIESAELGGLDILHTFAGFLFPALDNSKQPPEALTALVRDGHHGLKTGRGVYDWAEKDGQALLEARVDRLFQHKAEDDAV